MLWNGNWDKLPIYAIKMSTYALRAYDKYVFGDRTNARPNA